MASVQVAQQEVREARIQKELNRLQRKAANDDFHGVQNAQKITQGTVSAQKSQRITQQYAHNQQVQQARMLQAQQVAANQARYSKNRFILTPEQKKALAKAYKDVKKYDKAPFILAYTIAIWAEFFDIPGAIPIIGILPWIFSGALKLYLAIFIWRNTGFIGRRVTLILIVLVIDQIPVIGLLPLSILVILLLHRDMQIKSEEGKALIKKLTRKRI